ncbi:MAG: T9SS type A sorting domain-containing protein [Bacteroidota bacterium]
MKRLILCLQMVLLSTCIYAQNEWAPIGAVWYYDRNTDYEFGYVRIESVKDSLVQEKTCRILYVRKSTYRTPGVYETTNLEPVITRQEGSKVYYFQDGQFHLLYDFDPLVGDVWDIGAAQTEPDECSAGKVIVDSIQTVSLGGNMLKAIYTSPYENSPVSYSDRIIEGVGSLGYLLPFSTCTPPQDGWKPGGPIRCYSSAAFSYSWGSKDCDYITGINKPFSGEFVFLYPNPFTDKLHLKIPETESGFPVLLTIYSLDGEVLRLEMLYDEYCSYVIQDMESGLYILTVSKDHKILFYSKMIKR